MRGGYWCVVNCNRNLCKLVRIEVMFCFVFDVNYFQENSEICFFVSMQFFGFNLNWLELVFVVCFFVVCVQVNIGLYFMGVIIVMLLIDDL